MAGKAPFLSGAAYVSIFAEGMKTYIPFLRTLPFRFYIRTTSTAQ